MKYAEINAQTIFHAVKRRWKTFFLTVLLFSAVGLCGGFLFSGRLSAPADGGAAGTMLSDYSQLTLDDDYYTSCKTNLLTAYNNAVSYLSALSSESTATQAQQARLGEYEEQLRDFNSEVLAPIQTLFSSRVSSEDIYIPPQLLEEVTAKYEALLKNTRLNLIAAEAAVDIVKSMDSPDTQSDEIDAAYVTLLKQAAQYGNYKKNEAIYESVLNQLTQEPERVADRSRKLERELNSASRQLNGIIEDLNQTADEMAKENFFNLSVAYDNNNAIQVTINHTHAASDRQEAFLVITLFCVLAGICCGMFFAVCREAFQDKKRRSLEPQAAPERQDS